MVVEPLALPPARAPTDRAIVFGRFKLFPRQRLLEENGAPVRLGSRAFELLLTLVEQKGAILSKAELLERVWPDTNVEEGSLRVSMAAVKKALGQERADASYIKNVPGKGYCFVAPIADSENIRLIARPARPGAANGYLIDQFLQDGSNKRTDEYGGSIKNRARLLLRIVGALVSVWGGDRVAVRIGPGGTWNGMSDSNPSALFSYVAESLNPYGLAYLHIIEPRIAGSEVVREGQGAIATEQLRKIFKNKIIAAGGFEPGTAAAIVARTTADAVAFGRHFLANPDLPRRIRRGLPLADYDRETFYTFGAHGYTDYPFYPDAA